MTKRKESRQKQKKRLFPCWRNMTYVLSKVRATQFEFELKI